MKRGEQIISGRKTVRTEILKAFTMKARVVTFRVEKFLYLDIVVSSSKRHVHLEGQSLCLQQKHIHANC